MDTADQAKDKKEEEKKSETPADIKATAKVASEEANVEAHLNAVEAEVKDEQGKVQKKRSIGDRTLRDDEIPGFVDKLKSIGLSPGDLNDEDVIDLFLLYKESPEEYERRVRDKYLAWAKRAHKEAPKFWQNFKKALKSAGIRWNYGNFPHGFVYERVYGALLDKHVQELHSANLNARDRIKLLDHAYELGDKFEAQSILLSLAHTSDFDEELYERYHEKFSAEDYVIVRHASGPVTVGELEEQGYKIKNNEKIVDWHGEKVLARLDRPGTVDDMWFEVKLRRETHVRGKRPDVWHAGRRDYLWHGNHIVGVSLKSEKWVAEETNFDGRLTPGRKGDTASETFQYNLLNALGDTKLLVKATRLMLEKKLANLKAELEAPAMIERFGQEKAKLQREIETLKEYKDKLPDVDTIVYDQKIVELEQKLHRLEKKRRDDEMHAELIEQRLREGIDPNDIKSLLLDKASREYVDVPDIDEQGNKTTKRVYEYQLGYSRGTFIYAMARAETDVRIITNAEHVTAEERLSQAQFFSDRYRDELQWRAQHYSLGIHDINGNYDAARDGAQNIWKLMFKKRLAGGQSFQQSSLGYFVSDDAIEGSRRIVTDHYDDKTKRTYQVWLDYQLPDDPAEELKDFNRADPKAPGKISKEKPLVQEWEDLVKSAYEKGHFYGEKPLHEGVTLGRLADALRKEDSSHALEVLSNPKTGRLEYALSTATKELKEFRQKAASEQETFVGLPPAYEKQLIEVITMMIQSNEDLSFRVSFEALIATAPNLMIGSDEEQKIKDGLAKINSKLDGVERAFANVETLRNEYQPQIEAILSRQGGDSAIWYVRKIESSLKGNKEQPSLSQLKNSLPLDRDAALSPEQREQIARATGEPVPEDTTAIQAFERLNKFQLAIQLALRELLPSEEEEKPQPQEQRQAAESVPEE